MISRCTGYDSNVGLSRRLLLERFGMGLGAFSLGELLHRETVVANPTKSQGGVLKDYHHRPKAKRVIFLFQSGGPSQIDLMDYKPYLLSLIHI